LIIPCYQYRFKLREVTPKVTEYIKVLFVPRYLFHQPKKDRETHLRNVLLCKIIWYRIDSLFFLFTGQDGYSHVNNRPFEYVKNTFDKLGFDHDLESSKKIQKAATLEWLQWNTNVYRRRGDLTNIESILRDDTWWIICMNSKYNILIFLTVYN
jgi:hypothetical protein